METHDQVDQLHDVLNQIQEKQEILSYRIEQGIETSMKRRLIQNQTRKIHRNIQIVNLNLKSSDSRISQEMNVN